MRRNILTALAFVLCPLVTSPWTATGEQIVNRNGIQYRETTEVVRRPVSETRYETEQQTVYRQELKTQIVETRRTVLVPVTEYRWETRVYGLWPIIPTYTAQTLVPYTRYETREEIVRTPLTRSELVPETRMVQKPVTTHRFVEEEVVRRVPISAPARQASAAPMSTSPVSNERIGGVAQMTSDPPRQSTTAWRAGQVDTRRY